MEKLRFKLLLLLMLCIICSAAATVGFGSTNCKEVERNALLRFKHSLIDSGGGDLLGSWVGQDCCNWKGVGCNNLTGHVTTLDLGGSASLYAGEVNPALLELKHLTYLDLSFIYFNYARIPQFLGSMTQLQHLNLSSTSFSGEVPQNLGNLTKLVSLDLSYCDACKSNNLGWASKLGNLQYLDLSGVDLSQANDSLGVLLHKQLPSLLVLKLGGCRLRNSYQAIRNSSISSSPLQHLDLSYNYFSGSFPSFIQNLSSIRFLGLSYNKLSSGVPLWLGNQIHLKELHLGSNLLIGSFPSSIQNLSSIESIDLSYNRFNSSLPSWISSKNLKNLQLSVNSFNGPFPQFIQNSSHLKSIYLSDNQFTFSIPSWLANNRELEHVDLSNNHFNRVDGGILNILGSLCSAVYFDLSQNSIQEEVSESPANFSRCAKYDLSHLILSHNNISGHLPILPTFSALSYLDLSHNNLSVVQVIKGEEREYTSVLHLLVNIDLSCNNLVGVIPTNLTSLSLLMRLNLSHNHLTGAIPKEIGKMMNLESLDLSSNHLTGSIPESISSLTSLSKMNLSFNSLSGQIPTSHQLELLDDPTSIYLGNPGLCGYPLPRKCFGEGIAQTPTSLVNFKDEDKHEKMLFYIVIMWGFASGFWAVIGILVVKRRWRHAYFGLAEEIGDWLYVRVALWFARIKRRKVNAAQASRE